MYAAVHYYRLYLAKKKKKTTSPYIVNQIPSCQVSKYIIVIYLVT